MLIQKALLTFFHSNPITRKHYFPAIAEKAHVLLQSTSYSMNSVGKPSHHLRVQQPGMWANVIYYIFLECAFLYFIFIGVRMPLYWAAITPSHIYFEKDAASFTHTQLHVHVHRTKQSSEQHEQMHCCT